MSNFEKKMRTPEQCDLVLARLALVRSEKAADEVSDLCRQLVNGKAARAQTVERLNDPHLSAGAWTAARWEVCQKTKEQGPEWIELTCKWLLADRASWQRSSLFCSDIAWTLESLDPYARALYARALLAQGLPSGLTEMRIVRQLEPKNTKVAHALLRGLHHGDCFFRQPQKIIDRVISQSSIDWQVAVMTVGAADHVREAQGVRP